MQLEPHPVILFPEPPPVFDGSLQHPEPLHRPGDFGIGRYNEKRPALYSQPLFGGIRNNHIGIDFFGPAGTPLYAFSDGGILLMGRNPDDGDYGYVIITQHVFEGRALYALWGHLQKKSLDGKTLGQKFSRGDVLAYIGAPHENGGWEYPHLHFQISFEKPSVHDMPGVVSDEDLVEALIKYPDPRLVLGPVY